MRDGISQSEIARRLHITRQAVNQMVQTIPVRITEALNDAAKLNGVETKMIDSVKGVMLGYSREIQTNVVITMHPETGLRIWYQHNLGRCDICPDKKQCKSKILKMVDSWGVTVTAKEKNLAPSKLANLVFSKAFGSKYWTDISSSTYD
jgi:DNA-binding transcriptional regulator LsrR (DeoR family)